jgi:hypothetical protein
MDKVNIGFIGGCINNQRGLQREDLYHAVLLSLLSHQSIPKDFKVSLATYLSYDRLAGQAEQFILNKQPDMFFLFIRPFPLMPLHKPIVRFEKENGEKAMAFHPGLFNRKLRWKTGLTEWQSESGFEFVPKKRFGLRDLNLLAGLLTGLHRWSMKYITAQVDDIRRQCLHRGIRLFIISPPKSPGSALGDVICRRTTNHLDAYCSRHELVFININAFSSEYFEKDQIHFNARGHRKLAEILLGEIRQHVLPGEQPSENRLNG